VADQHAQFSVMTLADGAKLPQEALGHNFGIYTWAPG
jgi:hypothetical protein